MRKNRVQLNHGYPRRFQNTPIAAAVTAAVLVALSPALHAQNSHSHAPAATSAAQQSHRAELDKKATDLGNGLLRGMKAFENASSDKRSQRASEVLQIVQARRQALLELVEADPGRVLALALPPELRARLPQQARDLVEQRVEAEGVVAAMILENHERGVSKQAYFLEVDGRSGNRHYNLHWADTGMSERQQEALVNKRVRLKAMQLNGHLIVGNHNEVEDAALGGKKTGAGSGSTQTSTSTTDAYATSPAVSGDQKTLVIVANFSDKGVGCSVDAVRNTVFGTSKSANQILRESSRNAVSLSGDVVGPFSIPYSSTSTCDYRSWGAAADAAAKAAGIDPSRYTRISYALPPNSCGWGGIANLGGTPPTRSWIAYCAYPAIFAHEIGHNLSFHHASTPSSEYGDLSDPMGNNAIVQSNGSNKSMAGWLSPGNVVDASSSGSYTLSALAAPDNGSAQVIRLRKTDTNEFYYVSLRQGIDLDANLSSTYRDRISIHTSSGVMPVKTVLRSTLGAGQSFQDSVNGITITAQSISSGSAMVSLQTSGAACSAASPGVSVGPSSQTTSAGATAGYSVTITNNDSSVCGNTSFSVAQSLPAGFSGSFSTSSIQLSPGASASIPWSVTPGTTIADGIYALKVSTSASGHSSATASASLQVYTQDGTSGTSGGSTGSSGGTSGTSDALPPTVTVTWPQDGDVLPARPISLAASAYDGSGVARVDFLVNGTLVGSSTTAPYQVRWNAKKSTGSNTLTLRATDTAGNAAEASVRFTVK
ncbi:MAG: Ig-like domain-containing protein [Burkholderiaceae bacterium]|nr:Ig-like domain-containing protein [Burkholderiaceae bacterium]